MPVRLHINRLRFNWQQLCHQVSRTMNMFNKDTRATTQPSDLALHDLAPSITLATCVQYTAEALTLVFTAHIQPGVH